jgi:hypothetical protein
MRIAIFLMLFILALPGNLWAYTAYGNQELSRWAASDRCAAAAQKQFPDYTAESNAKRDQAMKQCLANGFLPPRNGR